MAEFNMQTIKGVKEALAAGKVTSEQLVKETKTIFDADTKFILSKLYKIGILLSSVSINW